MLTKLLGYAILWKKEGFPLTKHKLPLTATHLRILALSLMLLDHLWHTVVPGNDWMTYLGRMAFPIFAFQTAEGYRHTHDFKGYCKRLAIFALASEIPFNLMVSGSLLYPSHQNVMVTMLLGLLACRAYDRKKRGHCLLWLILGSFCMCDYSLMGVWTVLMFHVFREQKLYQFLLLAAINWFGFDSPLISIGVFQIPVQAFAIGAALPIFLYNGEKGRGGKWVQFGSYVFYPLHLLILGIIS